MNRADLIEWMIEAMPSCSIQIIEQAVKHSFELLAKALSCGERIEIRGLGSFSLRYRQPRKARNPRTGVIVLTPGKYVLHFKPGKELKERLNSGRDQDA